MNWFSTEEYHSTNQNNDHPYILCNQSNTQGNISEDETLNIETNVNNTNNRASFTQCSCLSSLVGNHYQSTNLLEKTSRQQLSEKFIRVPVIPSLPKEKVDYINNNVQNCINCKDDSINYLENVQFSHEYGDEIDHLYKKLRKNLKQNSLLEYYFFLILQHLLKSLILYKNNSINQKYELLHTTYIYNTYSIIVIWKTLIQNCHLLICSIKTNHQNHLNYFKTLNTVQKYKSKSLLNLSNFINYNIYPWNITCIYQSFSQCFRSSLPILKTEQDIAMNVNPINNNNMVKSTSSSDFESICSDNDLLDNHIESEHSTNIFNRNICLSKELDTESKDTQIKSKITLELSNLNSSNKNTFENLEKLSSSTNNELTHSSISNSGCSALYSQLPKISIPDPPPFTPLPPPPPFPENFFSSSKISFTSVSGDTSIEDQEIKNQTASSTTNISESNIHKLKPFRWTKVYTSKYNNVWNNSNSTCSKTSDHNETVRRKPISFINLSKLNILFAQKQKLSMKNPEMKASPNTESFCLPMSTDKQTVEREINHGSLHQKFPVDKNVQEGNLIVPPTSDPKLLRAINSYAIRGRSLSSSRTMEFIQKHEPNLLESQRCLNINIFLRQFRHIHINLLDLIDRCDGSSIGSERLKDLIKLLPTDQEIKCLKAFQGNVNYMDPAERFFYDLVRIPKYYHKIDSMLLKEEFQPTINWIKSSLDNVMKTSQEILKSPLICELLQTVLEIGNYMNEGNNLGSASGFKLSSLLKLSEVRSNDSKFTLLHFLVQEFKTNNPQMLRITDTLPYLKEASDVSLDLIIKEINRFKSRLQNMTQNFDPETFGEQSKICEFIEQSNKELNDVQTQMEKLQELEVKCAQYFCECPTQFRITECLQTFSLFFEKMKSTEQEIKEFEQMDKERLEKLNIKDTLNQTNTKYNHKNSQIVEDKPKSIHDEHNTMMNLISNNISNPRIVHNRSRSRSSANTLNFSNPSNSFSKCTIENKNPNKDKNYTDELNMVSKSTNISHSTSVFEHSSTNTNGKNNNIRIRSRQSVGQHRMNTKFQITDNEFERERGPWSQIQNQSINSSKNGINQQLNESKANQSSDEETVYHLNERIKRLALKLNKS
ncbi:unnamed protein product [Schistosoma rodhaini]|uniref:FH2 domain-containing protein n=1 Tax=Schistosoma rodhaini TaxID=6188 RepID=A0AA85G4F0_9TREM|nr:unnamed protein product [Schistosoma rodhaini]CAH8596420.1 unnamed protein product [Schistosoma rodhaini]